MFPDSGFIAMFSSVFIIRKYKKFYSQICNRIDLCPNECQNVYNLEEFHWSILGKSYQERTLQLPGEVWLYNQWWSLSVRRTGGFQVVPDPKCTI